MESSGLVNKEAGIGSRSAVLGFGDGRGRSLANPYAISGEQTSAWVEGASRSRTEDELLSSEFGRSTGDGCRGFFSEVPAFGPDADAAGEDGSAE